MKNFAAQILFKHLYIEWTKLLRRLYFNWTGTYSVYGYDGLTAIQDLHTLHTYSLKLWKLYVCASVVASMGIILWMPKYAAFFK